MAGWILSIVGIVFLGVLFDLIYPAGKTNAFCKSIFSIFAMIILISPILNLNTDEIFQSSSTFSELDYNITKSKDEALKAKILEGLKTHDIVGVDVEIESTMGSFEYEINNVYIDTTNLVLTERITNINKYEVITSLVCEIANVDKEKIQVYG